MKISGYANNEKRNRLAISNKSKIIILSGKITFYFWRVAKNQIFFTAFSLIDKK